MTFQDRMLPNHFIVSFLFLSSESSRVEFKAEPSSKQSRAEQIQLSFNRYARRTCTVRCDGWIDVFVCFFVCWVVLAG